MFPFLIGFRRFSRFRNLRKRSPAIAMFKNTSPIKEEEMNRKPMNTKRLCRHVLTGPMDDGVGRLVVGLGGYFRISTTFFHWPVLNFIHICDVSAKVHQEFGRDTGSIFTNKV